MTDQEKHISLIQKGQTAVVLRRELDSYLLEAEEEIIERAISQYEAQTLTPNFLWGIMGELALLRRLAQKLDYDVQSGVIAREKEIDVDGT